MTLPNLLIKNQNNFYFFLDGQNKCVYIRVPIN